MNIPDKKILNIIDALTRSNINFALYRLPWTDACYLAIQEEGDVEEILSLKELNERKGFVMAPFHTDERNKILLIRPDIQAFDWEEIVPCLEKLYKNHNISRNIFPEFEEGNSNDKETYKGCFEKFINALQENRFSKLVLSRYTKECIPESFSPSMAFIDACNSYPRMFIYLCHTTKAGTWIGSTPEIILSGHKDSWHTVALAGTMGIQNESIPTEWNKKNINEQKFVSDYIRHTIKKTNIVSNIEEKGPYTARAGNLVHLKTDFFFNVKNNKSMGSVLEWLHPTPAICGVPKDEAEKFILENENYSRRYYSGIIGWLDADNGTDLYVNLRCMQIGEKYARLYAGGGILSSSSLDEEWEETEKKLATMRKILNDNNK